MQHLYSTSTNRQKKYELCFVVQGSLYPVLCHGISVVIVILSILKGVKTIEMVNNVIVPVLLLIIAFSLAWSLSLTYAYAGVSYLFTPDWGEIHNI